MDHTKDQDKGNIIIIIIISISLAKFNGKPILCGKAHKKLFGAGTYI